ncbi:MAG: hypothetical protein IPF96_17950 [Rhodobacter sp.]|nr:hypothetical protein [Rhodobacter sp.]
MTDSLVLSSFHTKDKSISECSLAPAKLAFARRGVAISALQKSAPTYPE